MSKQLDTQQIIATMLAQNQQMLDLLTDSVNSTPSLAPARKPENAPASDDAGARASENAPVHARAHASKNASASKNAPAPASAPASARAPARASKNASASASDDAPAHEGNSKNSSVHSEVAEAGSSNGGKAQTRSVVAQAGSSNFGFQPDLDDEKNETDEPIIAISAPTRVTPDVKFTDEPIIAISAPTRVTPDVKFTDVVGEDRSRIFQVKAFFSTLRARNEIPSKKNDHQVTLETDFNFEVSQETKKQLEYRNLLTSAKELKMTSIAITDKLSKAENDLKELSSVKPSTLSSEQKSQKQLLIEATKKEIKHLTSSLHHTTKKIQLNQDETKKLGCVDMHPDTSAFNVLKSNLTTSSRFPTQRDLFLKFQCVLESLKGSNDKLNQLGKSGPSFTYLSDDGTEYAKKPHALILSKYCVLRVVVSACLEQGLFIIDWNTHRIVFTKTYSSEFPGEQIFHAFMVALWNWLGEKVESFNKKKKVHSMTLEKALSSEDIAISVFAPFLKKVKVPPGSEVERTKKTRKSVKKSAKSNIVDDDAPSNSGEEDGNYSEGEEDEDGNESECGLLSVTSSTNHSGGGAACVRGGGAARHPSKQLAPSSKPHLVVSQPEESLDYYLELYRSSMRTKFDSQSISRPNLGCSSVIPDEAFKAYQAIKDHSRRVVHQSVYDILIEKSIICKADGNTFTITGN